MYELVNRLSPLSFQYQPIILATINCCQLSRIKGFPLLFPAKCFRILINSIALSTASSLNSKSSLSKSERKRLQASFILSQHTTLPSTTSTAY
nr:MAG TPA: hypothetical protein [Caudoviricetes sp.]